MTTQSQAATILQPLEGVVSPLRHHLAGGRPCTATRHRSATSSSSTKSPSALLNEGLQADAVLKRFHPGLEAVLVPR